MDRDTAYSILIETAARLIRQQEWPDPDDDGFRPIGKRQTRFFRRKMRRDGSEICRAVRALQKLDRNDVPKESCSDATD